MATQTQLSHLRAQSAIDCDTLDVSVAEALGPFADCTSNQAIALGELTKPANAPVLTAAATIALSHPSPTPTLVSEIASCLLSARILPHLTGYVHTQTNPLHAFSTSDTVADARRIVSIYATLSPSITRERVCIKIPSTWEGLQACRILEAEGIRTLATTLFTLVQAKMAARVGCTYVAPYVNALRVHFEEGYVDAHPGFEIAVAAQKWYEVVGAKTQVLAASFVAPHEVMRLAGLKHVTVSPPLLAGFSQEAFVHGQAQSLVDAWAESVQETEMGELLTESQWRLELNREDAGRGALKLVDAINIFSDVQEKLDALCAGALETVRAAA
ncbi:transaldolase [Tricharina praecox]|uniref:transaldolase n=1 Tax=Tricharina praecox TaxID=43433 RepID=UPI00221F365A|nr:transaldolase [Tricharina praecox]KAI5845344.1 transaldolase [Tricharina praecox]